jgi:protein-S-isoprenylcysteine O-methyltransferase Ste14
MSAIPEFEIGWMNGWLYLVAYFLGLIIMVISFPGDKRKKLFYEPVPPKGSPWKVYLAVGRVAAITFNLLMIWTPLQTGTLLFFAGTLIYLLGYVIVMVSLVNFKRTPVDKTVTQGLYRFSRNPQWIGLALVFVGTGLASASWLHMGLVSILVVSYHFQILTEEKACEGFYGDEYRQYMKQLPRYLLWR